MRLLEDMKTNVDCLLDKETVDIVKQIESDVMTEDGESSVNQSSDDVLISCDSLVKIFKTEDIDVMALQGLDMEIQ